MKTFSELSENIKTFKAISDYSELYSNELNSNSSYKNSYKSKMNKLENKAIKKIMKHLGTNNKSEATAIKNKLYDEVKLNGEHLSKLDKMSELLKSINSSKIKGMTSKKTNIENIFANSEYETYDINRTDFPSSEF